MRIALGPKGVWGVNSANEIYKKTTNSWEKVAGGLKDISVGKDSVWGVNGLDDIYVRTGAGGWQHIPGKLMQVSIVMVGLDIRLVVLAGFRQRI